MTGNQESGIRYVILHHDLKRAKVLRALQRNLVIKADFERRQVALPFVQPVVVHLVDDVVRFEPPRRVATALWDADGAGVANAPSAAMLPTQKTSAIRYKHRRATIRPS